MLLHIIFTVSLAGEVKEVGFKLLHYFIEVFVAMQVFIDCILEVGLVD